MKKARIILGCMALVFVSAPTMAQVKTYGNVEVTKLGSVYDGDTFHVNIDEFPAIIGQNIPVRVNGIDTPEMHGKCESEKALAKQAKTLALDVLSKAQHIELRNLQRPKYFRLLADVYVDGQSLSKILLDSGLARPYDGGTKQSWCD